MSNEVPLQKQIVTMDLSKGLDERSRSETLPIATGISKLENLVQDQAGAWVKRPGTARLVNALTTPKRIIKLLNGVGVMDGTGTLQHVTSSGVSAVKAGCMEFTSSAAFVSSTGSASVNAIADVASFASTPTHDAVTQVSLGWYSVTITERLSGRSRTYAVSKITGAPTSSVALLCASGSFIYVFMAASSAGSACKVWIINPTNGLPANEAAITLLPVATGLSLGGISNAPAPFGSATYGYIYLTIAGTKTLCQVNSVGTVVNTAIPALVDMASDFAGVLWVVDGANIRAYTESTMTVVVASYAHGLSGTTYLCPKPGGALYVVSSDVATLSAASGVQVAFISVYKVAAASTTLVPFGGCIGWRLCARPIYSAASAKVYVQACKDDPTVGATLAPNVLLGLDDHNPLVSNAASGAQVPFGAFHIASVIEPYNALRMNGSAAVTNMYSLDGGYTLTTKVDYLTAARSAGVAIHKLSFMSSNGFQNVNFGGSSHIAHGGIQSYDGNRLVEAGFLDYPVMGINAPAATAGNLNGSYRYVAVFRYTDATGAVGFSRVYGPIAATNVAASTGKNFVVLQCCGATNKESGDGTFVPVVELYRTIAGGTQYFICASSAAFTTSSSSPLVQQITADPVLGLYSFTDNLSDTNLAQQALMYRQPGTVNGAADRHAPPGGRILCQHKDRLFTSDPYGLRVYYSSFFVDGEMPWFNPAFSFFVHAGTGPITAIASMDGRLFVFKRDSIFVVDGDGPTEAGPTGTEYSPPTRLATTYGALDARSVLVTAEGIMYQSARGIEMLTRSLQVKWTGDRIQNTIALYPIVTGCCMDTSGRARFTLAASDPLTSLAGIPGAEIVYDFPSDCWSTSRFTGNSGTYGDAKADVAIAASTYTATDSVMYADGTSGLYQSSFTSNLDGVSTYVPFTIETGWMKQAPQARQRITQVMLLAKKRSGANHALKMSVAYDYSDTYTETYTWQPDVINTLTIEQLEMLTSKPQCLSVRVKFEDLAPTNLVTYPVGTGAGADMLGIACEIAPKVGMPKLAAAQKGYTVPTVSMGIGTELLVDLATELGDTLVTES